MESWIDEVLEEKPCEYCGKMLLWVRTVKGYVVPLDKDTHKPHRLSCPKAHLWSRKTPRNIRKRTPQKPRKPLQEYLQEDTLR